ncbi:hypothetical protein ACTXT7_005322 [Hymenolepis weldensis]
MDKLIYTPNGPQAQEKEPQCILQIVLNGIRERRILAKLMAYLTSCIIDKRRNSGCIRVGQGGCAAHTCGVDSKHSGISRGYMEGNGERCDPKASIKVYPVQMDFIPTKRLYQRGDSIMAVNSCLMF